MEESGVPIIPGTQIQLQIEGLAERFKSLVVGVDGREYLVIKTPQALSSGPSLSQLAAGSPVVVRYLHRGAVWGFRSVILHRLAGRFNVLFIDFPAEVENFDLRGAKRIDARIPAAVFCGDRSVEGLILDLSATGARMVYKAGEEDAPKPELEAVVRVSAHFAGTADPCAIEAVVRNRSEDVARVVLGLEFKDVDPSAAEQISRYLREVEESFGI